MIRPGIGVPLHRAVSLALILVIGLPTLPCARAAEEGQSVAILFNRKLPESKALAEYYAACRSVPTNHIFGLELPSGESMTRAEFRDELQRPLLKLLEETRLFAFGPVHKEKADQGSRSLVASKIRYLAICYGVPVRIQADLSLVEEGSEKIRPELRRNDAAVDSELALLPIAERGYRLYGPAGNPFFNVTNAAWSHPTNGILLVARLDGPTPDIARSLVNKAMEAETNGLWGRAYFDARGLTNTSYKIGDDWIRSGAEISRRFGFETTLDDKPETFSATFPMSQIAIYAGWYDGTVSGPFTRPKVEFMPGAIAYHLHSFSAHVLRAPDQHWVGPLLAKGATATMGCVEEPYLEGTPDVAKFLIRIYLGWSFAEAAYACQSALSWQTTVVGDPLYRPFRKPPQELHENLLARGSKLVEWSELMVVNRNLLQGATPRQLIGYLEPEAITQRSAVLQEKIGDLYESLGKLPDAIDAYVRALELDPSPQQRIRITLGLGATLTAFGKDDKAFALYQKFLKDFPDYLDVLTVYQKLAQLAEGLGKKPESEHYRHEVERLTTAAK